MINTATTSRSAPSAQSAHWRAEFEAHEGQHHTVQFNGELPVSGLTRSILGPSLATFQVGESGTGEHLLNAAAAADTDDDYQRALALFVGEEQEHARLLALVLDRIGYQTRQSHWTDRVFMAVRRMKSLRTEVLTLMVAEVIALRYYAALRDRQLSPELTNIFARIHADEARHVAFHNATLPVHLAKFNPVLHALVRVLWNVLVFGASVMVAIDHGRVLALAGVPRTSFVSDVWRLSRAVDAQLFRRNQLS